MEKLNREENGKKVRYGARCNYCKSELAARSSIGTGHLIRHLERCKRKAMAASSSSQSQLHCTADGVRHFQYDAKVARNELIKMIARLDLPLSIGSNSAFEDYIRTAHNPSFKVVSRQTTTRDLEAYFNMRKTAVKELLNDASCVCLTSDIWSGNAKEDYLSVVFHFVTSQWELEKRIVGMRLIDCSHSGKNIAERITNVVSEYDMSNKVLSITLDNASANTRAVNELAPLLSAYVGTSLLHQRCACHIINLIVKAGLKRIKPFLEDFRTAISFLNSSNQRIAAYKSFCLSMGVRPRKFALDMDVRWNATYLMLKHLVPYKSTFSVFIHTHYQGSGTQLLTDSHWYVAEHMLNFLELFYVSTVSLSGIYYPTSPSMMHAIIQIADHLNQYENDSNLRDIVVPMKSKFLKYWSDIPLLYSLAFILDPRAKMTGFNNALQVLSQLLNRDYASYYTKVKSDLTELYRKYEVKFDSIRLQRPTPQPSSAGKQVSSWDRIFSGRSTSSTSSVSTTNVSSNVSDLSTYLDSDCVTQFDDSFNILNWWQDHKRIYPILSIVAKDILTVPVSTISSESAFSLCGRLIEERRRSLTSDHVEMLSLLKDWEDGDARQQHNLVDQELEEKMNNLFLD